LRLLFCLSAALAILGFWPEVALPEDKPKRTKSWREIDKKRDSGGPRRREDRERDSFQQTTGYTKYKANLDRLFSGGVELPEHLREKSDPTGEKTADAEARKQLYAIEDGKIFAAAATEFLKSHAVPDDARLLDRLLSHPDEEIVERSLTRLEELQKAGALKAPPALSQRLANVEVDSGTPSIRRRAAELRKAIRSG
jgi:hypothetical protein